jgi:hypothetical protein
VLQHYVQTMAELQANFLPGRWGVGSCCSFESTESWCVLVALRTDHGGTAGKLPARWVEIVL